MDIFLLIIGFLLMLLGIVGSILPVLPGLITSWFGLLILHFTSVILMNYTFLGITLAIAIFLWIIDYFIPAIATKRFGGSKYGAYGTTIGLVIGFLIPIPFGLLIGAFLGAFIGEMIYDRNNKKRALKASFGAFVGFLASAAIEFGAAVIYLFLFVMKFWEYKLEFF
jgi:uncharacterized protein YqgC (DUF456 family)